MQLILLVEKSSDVVNGRDGKRTESRIRGFALMGVSNCNRYVPQGLSPPPPHPHAAVSR